MNKPPISLQRKILLRVLLCFSLLKACAPTAAFSNIDLSKPTALNPLSTGFVITGGVSGDNFGYSVGSAGDIDNDGYDDIIFGNSNTGSGQGAVNVVYGGEKSSMTNLDLNSVSLDPQATGFRIGGNAAFDYFGKAVSTAGDIDNDGYDDIIIGADGKNSQAGVAYVIYGSERATRTSIVLSTQTLYPHSTGFMIAGNSANNYLGTSVSTAGDFNNDGYADVIVGAAGWNSNQGAAYVVYGGDKSSMADIYLSTDLDPLNTGFKITGATTGDKLGVSVSTAGDIDNDGYDDIIVGASGKNVAYVIYGRDKASMSNIALSSALYPQTKGFIITGAAVGDNLGISVSTAGDINNDGYDDIIVGASGKNSNQGVAYVIYGGKKSSMSNIYLSTDLDPATTGFKITGKTAGDYFGCSVKTAGDVNSDGYDDIIIGAYGKNSYKGAAYIVYGGKKSSMTNINLSTDLDPLSTGLMIIGNTAGNYFGASVSTAGDTNKDGCSEVVIGAYVKMAVYLISPAQCSSYCNQCSSFNQCTQCKDSHFLYHSECLASCPNTTFTGTDKCEDCSNNCNVCSSSSICTECISPSVLYRAQCLASCPSTFFNSSNVCKSCPSHCLSCTSQDSCQVCFEGYSLYNSLCVISSQGAQEEASQALASVTKGLGSVVSVGSSIFPLSALVSKIVQNTRYLNLSVTSELAEIYQTWDTDLISWDVPNMMSDLDHFEEAPILFGRYDIDSPFLVNFWPTLINIAIGFGTFGICIMLRKLFEHEKYEGWGYNLVLKLVAGSFNFALVQAYACLDDILFYLVLDAKTNPFNSFFSWMSIISAVIFLVIGCSLVFFNFWTVKKYQDIKHQGTEEIEAFNEENKYWELFYSDFNDADLWSQSFFASLIIRSSLSSLITTVFYDYPLMQTSYLVMLGGAIILFLYFENPFNTLRGKLAQYYFETITLLVHLCTFILALQEGTENPSDTVRSIMSKGIIYLNTTLITGAIGFMFIESYKTISQKTRAARKKQQRESIPKDNQETQNLTRRKVTPFESQNLNKEQFHVEPYMRQHHNLASSNSIDLGGSSHSENSILPNLNAENRTNGQRNQSCMPILIRRQPSTINQREQRSNPRNPSYTINYE